MKGLRRTIAVGIGICAISLGCGAFTPTAVPSPTPYQVVVVIPNETPVPTPTPLPTSTATPTPTVTPTTTDTPPPSATPSITHTPPPSAAPAPIDSQVCQGCRVRLRETPGTAGRFITWLDGNVAFTATGRSEDGGWLQVELKNDSRNRRGWLSRQFTDLREVDVSSLPVTGVAIEATGVPAQLASNITTSGYISGVTAKAREIYLRGQELGNRPNVFSRVGDSITASPYFLTPFGSGSFDLGDYHNQLIEVTNYFLASNARGGANAFANASLAAGNGWGADRILQPGYSAPDLCGSDPPLVCEYRIVKPAIAIIMIGTNDSGGVAPGEYEANLRRIVEISIEMGVIPVLSTIPPKLNDAWNNARAIEWNGIITMVARQYDIPLIDLNAAMQLAPNQGIGRDGIHPSVPPDNATGRLTAENLRYGYTIRNLVTLQALDAIWRLVMY